MRIKIYSNNPKLQKMSGIINPMNHGYFKKWKEYVEGHGGKIFCAVLGGGKVTTTGDRAIFDKYLVQDTKSWIPPTPLPKLPAKLSEMMDYKMCEEVKRTSTIYLKHFLLPGQLLGKVS